MSTNVSDTIQNSDDEKNKPFPGNHAFAPALLDPDLDIPNGLVGPDGKIAPKRFSVYRNNVVMSLMEAMAETFPSIQNIIGAENFFTLTRIFIANHPPNSPMMQSYGGAFPQFVKAFAPLQHLPFLPEVAALEQKWIEAYHAADAPQLDGTILAEISPEILMKTRFVPHPATGMISSNYALYELFMARYSEEGSELDFAERPKIGGVLVTRVNLSIEVTNLDPAMTRFFEYILEGQQLETCIEQGMGIDETFDASAAITLMLTSAAITKLNIN